MVHEIEKVIEVVEEEHDIFVGREQELEKLKNAFHNASNKFSLLQIVGPVGVGKTYLLKELLKKEEIHYDILLGRGISFGSDIQYHAIKNILTTYFGITKKDSEKEIKDKIKLYIEKLDLEDISYTIPLIGALLSGSFEKEAVLDIEDPVEKKQLFHNAFIRLMEKRSKLNPILIIIEDGEWIDTKTIEVLNFLIRKKIKNIFLLVLTRDELALRKSTDNIYLSDFDETDAYSLIEQYPHLENVPAEIKQSIFDKSKGNPYFIHEILSSMRELGLKLDLPDTVYKTVLSRMDLLSEKHKSLLQTASVIGVEFTATLLKQIVDGVNKIDEVLAQLVEKD